MFRFIWVLFHFHFPERKYHKLSYRFESINEKMGALNEKRKDLQKKLSEISSKYKICAECNGRCCLGNYDHFTVIDYIIRGGGLDHYGEIWKPHSLSSIVYNRLIGGKYNSKSWQTTTTCPDLITTGCRFSPEDMPIRCVLWTCRQFRDGMTPEDLKLYGKLTAELSAVSCSAIELFQKK